MKEKYTLADKLIMLRLSHKPFLTQGMIARIIGVSPSAYSRYETGSRTPSIELIKKLAVYYRVSIESLLDD